MSINWLSQNHYEKAMELSKESGKPILIYFHSETCLGCQNIKSNILVEQATLKKVESRTIPVWVEVESDKPDPMISRLVGSHIFIMSPTVQLIDHNGDIYHKFLGAPLHTRLSLGYTKVHHDIFGDLDQHKFNQQLEIGLAKWDMFRKDYGKAVEQFDNIMDANNEQSLAYREAAYWQPIASNEGGYPEDETQVSVNGLSPLAKEVKLFCDTLKDVPDSDLMIDWKGDAVKGWEHYTDCLREFVFGVYQCLIDFSIEVKGNRARDGQQLTAVQEVLREWQVAFRALQGVMAGLKGADVDAQHLDENYSLGKQRTIRNNYVHCVMAEFWAHATSIRNTLHGIRNGEESSLKNKKPILDTVEKYGLPPENFGDINALIDISESTHKQLMEEFSNITDEELDSGYAWWENNEITIRFRLNRMGWHIYDHIAVIETICERIGRVRSECERLVALLYTALGKAESELVGLNDEQQQLLSTKIVEVMKDRRMKLEKIYK
ncbi:thioredoxin family protein [Pseudoalteromonas sp. ASV78]|uniref:thioredoxin family protein n=1 Tax=Pseudoalteromonas sp. ASV78 TaxID=3397851 RepID=UPI0039FD0ADC